MTETVPPPESDRPTPTTDLVRRAVLQLRAWGSLNQGQVRRFLPTWRHFTSLSPEDMNAIVAAFPPGDDNAVVPGRMIGGNR